jgi:decaprenylphospho-beta-D-erythro-pentofuranosid-2-ulose 2-reductase
MNDAFGHPQCVVVLGGTSDIARAVLGTLASDRCRSVVLAGRNGDSLEIAAHSARRAVAHVETVRFDALTDHEPEKTVARCFEAASEPVDLVLLALGELGLQEQDEQDPARVARLMRVNLTWPAAALTSVAEKLRAQGHGRIVVLSSVAGYRIRRSNYIYGSTKAGLDAFALGLGEGLRDANVSVHVVRPGFVHSKMTAGRPAAPFAIRPERVAADIVRGLSRDQQIIWSPPALRWMFSGLRMLPQSLWRRLPG